MKRLYYKKGITKSKNKMKTTWDIIHKEKGNLTNENDIKSLRINNHIVFFFPTGATTHCGFVFCSPLAGL